MADQTIDDTKLQSGGVASPFLPGTKIQYAWDSTSLGLFKTCPRLYQYTMIDGYVPKSESVHLRFGGEYHSALEFYDHARAKGIPHEDAIHDTIRETLLRTWDYVIDEATGEVIDSSPALPTGDDKATKYKNRNTLISLVIDYIDHFGPDDPAQTYIKADGQPAVELSFRFELDYGPDAAAGGGTYKNIDGVHSEYVPPYSQPYLLCGHLDRVVDFNDQLLVMDRKTTTTSLGPYYFKQYEPNNQMSLYTIAGKVVLDSPIRGVIIDAAQILLTEPHRFVRGFTYRTEEQSEEWLANLEITLNDAEAFATAEYWPMNDTACDKFGGCRFREICSKSPTVREKFLKSDFNKLEESERWNPLRSR